MSAPKNVFLFYGIEKYLLDRKVENAKSTITYPEMNMTIFDSVFSEDDVISACEQLPFMSEKRLVIVKGNFKSFEFIGEYVITGFPDTTLLILISDNVDKRTKLFKNIGNCGKSVEFKKLSELEAKKLIIHELNSRNACIEEDALSLFLSRTAYLTNDNVNLYDLVGYIDKLANYTTFIDSNIVNKVVLECPEDNIFKLSELIANNNTQEAFSYLRGLLDIGNNVLHLMSLITRHFRILYKLNIADTSRLDLNPYVLNQMKRQKGFFNEDTLLNILSACVLHQKYIKTGLMKDVTAIENLLATISTLINTDTKEGIHDINSYTTT